MKVQDAVSSFGNWRRSPHPYLTPKRSWECKGCEAMQRKMEITMMGYIGTTKRIHSFILRGEGPASLPERSVKICRSYATKDTVVSLGTTYKL